jgi:hypothetical protein
MNTLVHSEYILTPYTDEIIKDTNVPYWYENQHYNHIPYNFFVLTTRLTPLIPQYTVGFDSYRAFGIMRYTVILSDANNIVSLTAIEAQKYQHMVDDIISIYPDHCTLIFTTQPFVTPLGDKHRTSLPNTWVASVLPHCYKQLIKEKYDPIWLNNQLLINLKDVSIKYTDLSVVYKTYNDVYNKLQNDLINTLHDMYDKGTVFANPLIDQTVMDKWHFVHTTFNHLYTVNWRDERFAPDLTDFLTKQLQRQDYVMLHTNINTSWLEQQHIKYQVLYDKVYVKVDNLADILHIVNNM